MKRYKHDTSRQGIDRGMYEAPHGEWLRFEDLARVLGEARLSIGPVHTGVDALDVIEGAIREGSTPTRETA